MESLNYRLVHGLITRSQKHELRAACFKCMPPSSGVNIKLKKSLKCQRDKTKDDFMTSKVEMYGKA